jgi:7-carboxy-7-deazaguanine synthase
MSLNVADIFSSTQGEGQLAGQFTTFVRFGGCNVACNWCDETFAIAVRRPDKERIEPFPLCAKLIEAKTRHICITGGEPLIQNEADLTTVCNLLHNAGKILSIETNGTKVIPALAPYIDLWTISPKLSSADVVTPVKLLLNNVAKIREFAKSLQLKFVIGSREDVYDLRQYLSAFPTTLFYVQSMWIEDGDVFEPKYTIQDIQKMFREADIPFENLDLRFGVQLHKFFSVK